MSDVPDMAWQKMTVRARHRFLLEGPFHGQKAAFKLFNDAFYPYFTLINQAVGWVRPAAPIPRGLPLFVPSSPALHLHPSLSELVFFFWPPFLLPRYASFSILVSSWFSLLCQ
jgi:hypothetical protein